MSATRFKAQCLALMAEVAKSGQPLVVTKYKRQLVRVVPAEPRQSLLGSVRYLVNDDDLVAPLPEAWEASG